jgi:hypothetical protein
MSKGKHKRKREHRQHVAHQRVPDTRLIASGQDSEQSSASQTARQDKKEPSMGFGERLRELWNACSLTDRIIAIFTGVLACAAIYQFVIMGNQLDTMRKDQRPWVKVSFTPAPIQPLTPIGGTVHLVNNGKTPARGTVRGDFAVETVKNGEQPKLNYPAPHTKFTTGLITPNDIPTDVPVERARSGANKAPEADPLIASEFDDFNQVKIFFVVYGTVYYADFFGTQHWTKFCTVILPPNPPPGSTMTGQSCTNYGDVDSN